MPTFNHVAKRGLVHKKNLQFSAALRGLRGKEVKAPVQKFLFAQDLAMAMVVGGNKTSRCSIKEPFSTYYLQKGKVLRRI